MMTTEFCYTDASEATHQENLCNRDFAAVFIYKAQEGIWREHLQCSQSHFAAAKNQAVKIKMYLIPTQETSHFLLDVTKHLGVFTLCIRLPFLCVRV